MKLIDNKLIAEEGYLLKDINDNGETLEDGTFIEPYKTKEIYLAKQINSLEQAKELYSELSKYFMTSYDESGNIGKRYRRQDIMGTPLCITVDDETINNGTVTVRDRDTMEQVTLKLDEIKDYIEEKIRF